MLVIYIYLHLLLLLLPGALGPCFFTLPTQTLLIDPSAIPDALGKDP